MSYVICSDSAGDFNVNHVTDQGLRLAPLSFTIGGETYQNHVDHRDMPIKDFYQNLRDGKTATTAGDTLTLRLLIDTTTMELFFDGGIAATYTIHPDNMSLQFCGSAHVSSARQPLNSIHP